MRPQLPEETKRGVIRLWLSGLGRDNIARLTNISAGAVTNIVNKWREDIGKAEADAMRELAKSIRASNLSPAQCEVGFRILNILIKEGLDADKAEKFLSTTYKKCESADISPDNIVSHIEDLTEFSDEIRLPEIELHIKQETNKKEELDKQICERQEKVSSLKREEEELIKKRDCAFEQQKKAGEDFKIFVEAKQELERLNLSINNVPKFAQTVKVTAEFGYHPERIMAQIDEVFNFNLKRAQLNIAIYEMEKKSNKLNHQNSTLQYKINLYLEKLSVYRLLENHGLGHLELETLLKIILDIATANGVPYWLAVDKIFNDIRTQYAPKLDFESKIEDLKLDIQIISEEKDKKLDELKYLPFVCLTVSQLYALGLKGTEILQLGQIYHAILNKTYSVEDLATAIIKTIDVMSYLANKSEAIHNDKVAGILSRVREDLSQIHYTS